MNATPFVDLSVIHDSIHRELQSAFDRVLRSNCFILGPEVDAFEEEFASFCGAQLAVGVGSGLDALRLALLASGISEGDEVIVPSHTFIATWLAVTACGAVPVPVEPAEGSFSITAEGVEKLITRRTRAIIPVHLYGQPVDLDPIIALAARHDLRVIEDAAQAHGARYKGRRIGSHGDAVAWSFYPGKNLGGFGDGGAVTTNNPDIAEAIRIMRNYGSRGKYVHDIEGSNSRLDALQASLLRVKLKYLDAWNSQRQEAAALYQDGLAKFFPDVVLPTTPIWADSVWHLYVLRCKERDRLQQHLSQHGISTLIHYPKPPHLQAAYARLGFGPGSFPIAENLSRQILSLPMYPGMSLDTPSVVADIFEQTLQRRFPN